MIKSIHIENLESHEDTTIQFESGLNLICGLSNSGKSSMIRALGIVVNNNWNKSMVRTGCEFCRVKVETERGWVEADRGEKVNRWRCQENGGEIQNYKNVGTDVPDLATRILGMGERDRGAGIKELPNFQFQLERHYMLSEIGEKKATANMVAVMMDNAIGLGGMEELIKAISADLAKDKKWLTEKQNEITELKSKILDEKIYSGFQSMMNEINTMSDELPEMQRDLNRAENILSDYEEIADRKKKNDELIEKTRNCVEMQKISEEVERLQKTVGLMASAVSLQKRIDSLKPMAELDVAQIVELSASVGRGIATKDKAEKILELDKRLKDASIIAEVNLDKIDSAMEELSVKTKKVSAAERTLADSRAVWKKNADRKRESEEYTRELDSAEGEFRKLQKELKICPLCGRKLEECKNIG